MYIYRYLLLFLRFLLGESVAVFRVKRRYDYLEKRINRGSLFGK